MWSSRTGGTTTLQADDLPTTFHTVNVALVGDEAAASLVAVVPSISSHDAAAFDSDLLEATPKGERARFDIDTPSEEDLDEDAEDLDADDDYDDDYEYEDNDTEHEADNVAAAGAAPVGVAGAAQRNADDAHHHRHRSSSNSSTSSATKRATRGHRRHGHARAHRRVVGVNESRLDLQCLGIVHRTRTLLLPNCWLRVVLSAFDDTLLLDAMIAKEALARTQLVVVSFVVGDAVSLDRAELLLSRFARPPTEWKDIEQCEQHQQVDTHYSATTTTTTTITATTTTTAAGSSGSGGAATPSDASSTSTTRYLGLDVLEIEPITAAEFETVGPALLLGIRAGSDAASPADEAAISKVAAKHHATLMYCTRGDIGSFTAVLRWIQTAYGTAIGDQNLASLQAASFDDAASSGGSSISRCAVS